MLRKEVSNFILKTPPNFSTFYRPDQEGPEKDKTRQDWRVLRSGRAAVRPA
jgi:hypothetical protein